VKAAGRYGWCTVSVVSSSPSRGSQRRSASDRSVKRAASPARKALCDYAVVPHTVILSPGLVIEKVYVGYWFWGRPSPEQLWTDLGAIHARIKPDFDPTLAEPRAEWETERVGAGV
jgi:hypothetical protein